MEGPHLKFTLITGVDVLVLLVHVSGQLGGRGRHVAALLTR